MLIDSAKTPFGPTVTIEVNGIAYNPEPVPKPTGYRDLFENPAYDGRVAWIGFGSNTATMAWVEIAKIYGGGPDDMDPVFDLLKANMERIGAIATNGTQMTLYQQGEIDVFMASTGNVAHLRSLGLPCEFVHPETGSPAVPVDIHLTKGASAPTPSMPTWMPPFRRCADHAGREPTVNPDQLGRGLHRPDLQFVTPEQLAKPPIRTGSDQQAPGRVDAALRPPGRVVTPRER